MAQDPVGNYVVALRCSCGTFWTHKDIKDYNRGSTDYAAERHKRFWKMDGKDHVVERTTD